ncbi:MAG: flagellar motor switch protein FliM [Bdellovibrionales bacterium]|nr:flagellar motor switch protein FliM [Bdellovibrionales bacterium]
MAEILSQNEIDALLSAVSTGDVAAPSNKPGADKKPSDFDWVAYDLASQEKFLRGRLVALEGIHERFCRLLRATLHNLLKTTATVTYRNTEILRFSEYLSGITLPTSINIVSMRNPAGYMMFVIGSKLAYALVDAYYGGSERPFSQLGHRDDFTQIEKNLIHKTVQLCIEDLQEAWKLNYPVDLHYSTAESNPIFVSYIHGSESVAVVNFEVEFEDVSGPLSLIVQLRALDPIRKYLSVSVTKEITADKKTWKDHWENEISELPLSVVTKLGQADVSLRGIMDWKVGDTVILDQDAVAPLTVEVEGIPKFLGQMGVQHGSSAVKITEVFDTTKRGDK